MTTKSGSSIGMMGAETGGPSLASQVDGVVGRARSRRQKRLRAVRKRLGEKSAADINWPSLDTYGSRCIATDLGWSLLASSPQPVGELGARLKVKGSLVVALIVNELQRDAPELLELLRLRSWHQKRTASVHVVAAEGQLQDWDEVELDQDRRIDVYRAIVKRDQAARD